MIGAGIYLGAAFDTYSRLRWQKKNRWLSILQDILFWILNGLFIFIWLREVNQGEMRVTIFLSLFCGYASYQALFQSSYKKLLEMIIKIIISFYRFIRRLLHIFLFKPIYWLYQSIVTLILFFVGLILKLFHYVYSLFTKTKRGFFRWMAKWFTRKQK